MTKTQAPPWTTAAVSVRQEEKERMVALAAATGTTVSMLLRKYGVEKALAMADAMAVVVDPQPEKE